MSIFFVRKEFAERKLLSKKSKESVTFSSKKIVVEKELVKFFFEKCSLFTVETLFKQIFIKKLPKLIFEPSQHPKNIFIKKLFDFFSTKLFLIILLAKILLKYFWIKVLQEKVVTIIFYRITKKNIFQQNLWNNNCLFVDKKYFLCKELLK